MANLTPVPGLDSVPQLETNTRALGGPGGPMNTQAQALLNRSEYLNEKVVSVKDFTGANDSARALAMIAQYGYARFTRGTYSMSTVTLDAPLFFDAGASLTVGLGNSVLITSRVESPRQFIFQGAGSYFLGNDSDSGEEARQVHVSWFGAFPTSGTEVDQAPALNKLFAAVGNLRESVVQADQGRYHIGATVFPSRGTDFKGNGTRRTVFSALADGYALFSTAGVGGTMRDFQFELSGSFPGTSRTSRWIEVTQADWELRDIWAGRSDQGIVITGDNCRVRNITGTYGSAPAASGSSLIEINANSCDVDGVTSLTSAFGPEALVLIGGAAQTATKSNISVRNVKWAVPSIGVFANAQAGSLARLSVSGLTYGGLAGTNAALLFKTSTASTFSISELVLKGVNGSNAATNGIQFLQGSSGTTDNVVISDVVIDGSSGFGMDFTQTAGSFSNVFVGDTVNTRQRGTPFSFSGNTGGVYVSPQATPQASTPFAYQFSIADDAVVVLDLRRTVFIGVCILAVGVSRYGQFLFRAAPTTLTLQPMFASAANIATALTALTGTTGTDGNFTIGVQDKTIYLENRLGSTQNVSFIVMNAA